MLRLFPGLYWGWHIYIYRLLFYSFPKKSWYNIHFTSILILPLYYTSGQLIKIKLQHSWSVVHYVYIPQTRLDNWMMQATLQTTDCMCLQCKFPEQTNKILISESLNPGTLINWNRQIYNLNEYSPWHKVSFLLNVAQAIKKASKAWIQTRIYQKRQIDLVCPQYSYNLRKGAGAFLSSKVGFFLCHSLFLMVKLKRLLSLKIKFSLMPSFWHWWKACTA